MLYYREIDGCEVWVTVERPLIFDEAQGGYVEGHHCVAFKFHRQPGPIIGEYLREDDHRMRWFSSEEDAVNAAFTEAAARIDGQERATGQASMVDL